MELKMLNKQQRKTNNKELHTNIARQLAKCRLEKKILLHDIKKLHNTSFEYLDKIELSIKHISMSELQYIAAIYDKKIEINLVD